jgi:CBS domain-containing protein
MRAEEIMTRTVYSVRPETSLKEVATILVRRGIHGMPVVDGEGVVVGMITEADLIDAQVVPDPRLHARRDLRVDDHPPSTAGEVMSTRVVAARVGADLADLARMMLSAHLTRVPVVDEDDRLIGLVSRHDLVRLMTRPDADIAADVHRVLADWYSGPPLAVTVADGEILLADDGKAVPDLLVALIRAVPGVIGVRWAAPAEPGKTRS